MPTKSREDCEGTLELLRCSYVERGDTGAAYELGAVVEEVPRTLTCTKVMGGSCLHN